MIGRVFIIGSASRIGLPGGWSIERAVHDVVRSLSERLVEDRSLSADIERVATAIRSGAVLDAAEDEIGALA